VILATTYSVNILGELIFIRSTFIRYTFVLFTYLYVGLLINHKKGSKAYAV